MCGYVIWFVSGKPNTVGGWSEFIVECVGVRYAIYGLRGGPGTQRAGLAS